MKFLVQISVSPAFFLLYGLHRPSRVPTVKFSSLTNYITRIEWSSQELYKICANVYYKISKRNLIIAHGGHHNLYQTHGNEEFSMLPVDLQHCDSYPTPSCRHCNFCHPYNRNLLLPPLRDRSMPQDSVHALSNMPALAPAGNK